MQERNVWELSNRNFKKKQWYFYYEKCMGRERMLIQKESEFLYV
jgi:hypothetical protein